MRNILIEQSGGHWQISGLVDFERSKIGDPVEDFAMVIFNKELLAQETRTKAFFNGYLSQAPLPNLFDQRLAYHSVGLFLEIACWAFVKDHPYYERAIATLKMVLSGDQCYQFGLKAG
ncbi:MAG: phosphotransferase [Nitrosomonadales bacterium]|nr:phosphotransferase [Nitrosomonadales bacterium]